MSSKRRIESSRANGAKSRGPVTSAGRLKSSRNNLRHGLLAGIVVLDNEKAEAFTDLVAALTREIGPQTEVQRALVETMAVARWRLMRLWAAERATLQSEIEKHDPESHEPAPTLSLAFRALADQSRTLDLLNRYESRFDRQYVRSLNLLMKLASPDNPLTQFRHTNPVPQPDTPTEAETDIRWGSSGASSSGIGLLACPSAEGADQSPVEPAPTEPTPPIATSHTPDPQPLTPASAPKAPSPAPPIPDPAPATPAPALAPEAPRRREASNHAAKSGSPKREFRMHSRLRRARLAGRSYSNRTRTPIRPAAFR